jgi:transcriptional regulator with XRE-family HTH domain
MQVNPHALRVIRERSGLSVTELARIAGMSQPHLSNIETGKRQASPAVLRHLADALQVPLLALIGGSAAEDEPASGDVASPSVADPRS